MSMASELLAAATKLIATAGQSVTYKRGASAVTITARIGILTNAQKYEWFTSSETTSWDAPQYALQVAGDFQPFSGEPAVNDFVLLSNFAGASVQYDVKRWDKQKIGGIVIKTVLFVEKH